MKKSSKNVLAIIISVVLVVSMAFVVMISAFADSAKSEEGATEPAVVDEDVTAEEPEEPAEDEATTAPEEDEATTAPEEDEATTAPEEDEATTAPEEDEATTAPEEDDATTAPAEEDTTAEEPSSEDTSKDDEPSSDDVSEDTTATEPNYKTVGIVGDVDGNGKIQSKDARMALRFCARLDTPTDLQMILSDVSYDQKVQSSDARLILRYAAKLDEAGKDGNKIGAEVRVYLDWTYEVVFDESLTDAPAENVTAA